MNIEQARFNMIEQQIRTWDVLEPQVLALLAIVKRENFVPAPYKSLAFIDTEIPLPCGENMLMPKFEARILQEARVEHHENILEIGTGSGYMAALLAHKGRHVTTIEIEPTLKELAEKNIANNSIDNISIELGNGAQGWMGTGSNNAPYDLIVISASLPLLAPEFLQQIKIGGRIIATTGEAPVMTTQRITRTSETTYETVNLFETNIKPLRNAATTSHFQF